MWAPGLSFYIPQLSYGCIWSTVGHAVLLVFGLLKISSVAKSVFGCIEHKIIKIYFLKFVDNLN